MTEQATRSRHPLDVAVHEIASQPGRTWGLREALLGVLAVPLAIAVGALAMAAVPGVSGTGATAVAAVALAALTLVAVRRPAQQSGGVRRALGLSLTRPSDLRQVLGWTLLLLVVQFAAVAALSSLVPALRGASPDNVAFLRDEPALRVLLLGLLAVVVAPVLEELLFRGLVLRGLMLRFGFRPAAAVSSALFGLLHAQGSAADATLLAVATGVFGLGLCVLVRRTGRLGPAIGVHALRNALAVVAVLII